MGMTRSSLAALAAGVCLFVAAGPAAASQQTAAGIVGQVTDESGGVLPGVTVTASSPALQVREMVTITDERGEHSPRTVHTFHLAL